MPGGRLPAGAPPEASIGQWSLTTLPFRAPPEGRYAQRQVAA